MRTTKHKHQWRFDCEYMVTGEIHVFARCSCHTYIDLREIQQILNAHDDLLEACRTLVYSVPQLMSFEDKYADDVDKWRALSIDVLNAIKMGADAIDKAEGKSP